MYYSTKSSTSIIEQPKSTNLPLSSFSLSPSSDKKDEHRWTSLGKEWSVSNEKDWTRTRMSGRCTWITDKLLCYWKRWKAHKENNTWKNRSSIVNHVTDNFNKRILLHSFYKWMKVLIQSKLKLWSDWRVSRASKIDQCNLLHNEFTFIKIGNKSTPWYSPHS